MRHEFTALEGWGFIPDYPGLRGKNSLFMSQCSLPYLFDIFENNDCVVANTESTFFAAWPSSCCQSHLRWIVHWSELEDSILFWLSLLHKTVQWEDGPSGSEKIRQCWSALNLHSFQCDETKVVSKRGPIYKLMRKWHCFSVDLFSQ